MVLKGLLALGVEHLGRVRLIHIWLLPIVTIPATPSRGVLANRLGRVDVCLSSALWVLPIGLLR